MKRLSIHWLLLGVAAASLLLPALAIFSLRSFDAVLVRQTERELNAQGALVAAAYQDEWSQIHGVDVGDPKHPHQRRDTYTPLHSRVKDLGDLAPPLPSPLPLRQHARSASQLALQNRLSRVLSRAQIFNLSGVRVLDENDCAIASSRNQLDRCFGALPEVLASRDGRAHSALRTRTSDEPAPPLTSFSRRGDVRVFVALPVWNDGTRIGTVLLSRTAESGIEWLFKQRKDVFYSLVFMLTLAVGISLTFSLLITTPLRRMRRLLLSSPDTPVRLGDIPAPIEIHTLGKALDERAQQLDEKSRYVADFAANVSHELKTPLTSIQGAVELLQDESLGMDAEQRKRFLENISSATGRTERLVSRLLQLARLESRQGGLDEETIGVRRFMERLKTLHGEALDIVLNVPDDFKLPRSTVESMAGNLVDNALRYRQKRPVRLQLDAASCPTGHHHLQVSDDGPGITPENQKRLFERFFTTERDQGGTGLGLSIVRATAQANGGHVELRSDSQGTVVDVWF